MGGRGVLTMKWSKIGIGPKSFALEHDSLVNPTLNPEKPGLCRRQAAEWFRQASRKRRRDAL
jgi:hypothetical protein